MFKPDLHQVTGTVVSRLSAYLYIRRELTEISPMGTHPIATSVVEEDLRTSIKEAANWILYGRSTM